MNGHFAVDRSRAKVMGVAAGVSAWTGVDLLVVRLAMIVATLLMGPVAVLLYIVTGWLAASKH